LFYFEWPIKGDYAGFIQAQCLPHIGKALRFSPSEISKTTSISKPSPLISSYSIPKEKWNVSLSNAQGKRI
jgi:hypothetical protein